MDRKRDGRLILQPAFTDWPYERALAEHAKQALTVTTPDVM